MSSIVRKNGPPLMWKRIVALAVASQLLIDGACAVGWTAARAEYCQYGDYIDVKKCDAYELATVTINLIISTVNATLPTLAFFAIVAACMLTCSLHKSNDTLKRFAFARGAGHNACFSPAERMTNAGLGMPGSRPEITGYDTKAARAPALANTVAFLELSGSDVSAHRISGPHTASLVLRAAIFHSRKMQVWPFLRLTHLAVDYAVYRLRPIRQG